MQLSEMASKILEFFRDTYRQPSGPHLHGNVGHAFRQGSCCRCKGRKPAKETRTSPSLPFVSRLPIIF